MDETSNHITSRSALQLITLTDFDQNGKRLDFSNKVLLGQIINSRTSPSKGAKTKLFFRKLNFGSFHGAKDITVYTIKSLYHHLLIPQHSILKNYWDLIMELILVYNVLTTLFFLAYTIPGKVLSTIDFITWIFFLFDIILKFFTQVLDENGHRIKTFKGIALKYLKSWFLLDVFANLPLTFSGFPDIEFYFRMVRLLKLPKVLNITKGTGISYLLSFFNFGKRGKDGEIFYSLQTKIIASFVQIFIRLLFTVYFLGCFWFWIQKTVNNYKYSQGVNKDEKNFAEVYGLQHMSSEHIALRCSYYMLTTIATIGYGDFEPQNIYEMSFIIFVMLFGISFFAMISGSFINAISYYTEHHSRKDETGELQSWLESIERSYGKIPKTLQSQITDHFSYYFANDKVRSLAKNYWEAETVEDLVCINQHYVKHLPEHTYYEILAYIFESFLKSFREYFTESRFKFDIIPHLQPRKLEAGSFVLSSGQTVDDIVFVLNGKVSAGIDVEGDYNCLLFFGNGRTVIGDYNALTNTSSAFGYYAESDLDCLVVHAGVFLKILNTFYKSDKSRLMGMAVNREMNLRRLSVECTDGIRVDNLAPLDIFRRFTILKGVEKKAEEGYSEEKVNKRLARMQSVSFEMQNKSAGILKMLGKMQKIRENSFMRGII